jgi:quercetin dioxygenase-like cupin family protein
MARTSNLLTSKFHRAVLAAAATGTLALLSGTAYAGECPADKVVSSGQQNAGHGAKGVDDKVLASIDLLGEHPKLKDHKFRLRRLVVQPGGIVPWHSHSERPAIIYIVSGTIAEYSSTCSVPIVHRAGDVARETHVTSHWWKNDSKKPAVLLSADILYEKADPKTM